MKILHIISNLEAGGAETMLYRLIRNGDRQRFHHCVISLKQAGTLGPEIAALDVPVIPLRINGFAQALTGLMRFFRTLRKFKPDLVVGWMVHGNFFSWLARCFHHKTPIVWNIRQALYSMSYESQLTARFIHFCAGQSSKTSAILYNSKVGAEHHEALGYDASKRQVIANGFDLDVLKPSATARTGLRRELGLAEDAFIIGLVGRYHPMKDLPNLIRAAGIVSTSGKEAHCVLIGKNIDAGNVELTRLIEQERLSGRVHLLGERRDIPERVPGFDVSVCCSYTESFPNVVGEAMACGVPVIGTDVGETAEIIGGTGVVIPARDSKALADAIIKLMDMPQAERHALGQSARQRIQQSYELNHIVRRYESLYESVVEKKTA